MKRADLKVGARLYLSTHKKWETETYGRCEVEVVKTEPHESDRWNSKHRQIEKGNGVLVGTVRSDGTLNHRVVQLAHLRGPWAIVKADVDRASQRRVEEHHAQIERRDNERERLVGAVAALAEVVGFEVPYVGAWSTEVKFTAAQVEAIVAVLERLNAEIPAEA